MFVRPCLVKGKQALFHTWEQFANIIAPSLARGGQGGGQVAWVNGIVEYEDGTIEQVAPTDIKFVDISGGEANAKN